MNFNTYSPTKHNLLFDFNCDDFAKYIEFEKQKIVNSRVDLNATNKNEIIQYNSPALYYPEDNKHSKKYGVVLIHGLLDSSFATADLFEQFKEQGYYIHSLLLPGHGTRPGELLNIRADDWLQTTIFAIQTLRKKVDHLTIVGFSTGASLGIYLKLIKQPIDSIISIAPAFEIKTKAAILIPLINQLKSYSKYCQWIKKTKENDYVKYRSITVNSVFQLQLIMKKINLMLSKEKLEIPHFMILSDNDNVISNKAAFNVFNNYLGTHKQLLLYTKQANNQNKNIITKPNQYPQNNIIGMPHSCLTISPNNLHYGINGDYIEVLSKKINPNKPIMLGHDSKKYALKHNLHKLKFNPDFYNMFNLINQFILNH